MIDNPPAKSGGRRRRSAGFSLIELLMVMGVLGIISTLAVGGFQNMVRDQRVRNCSFELYASLTLARSEAIKRNADVTVSPAAGGWQNGWTIAASGTPLKTQARMNGITITGGPASVVYNKSGRLPPAGLPPPAFQVVDTAATSAYTRCLKIELSGMPRAARGVCT